MRERMNKSVWSGVFFPADDPQEISLVEQDVEDAPLDAVEVVETDFQVDRSDISEDTSVTNEVTETPKVIDESESQESPVETLEESAEEVSDTPASEDVVAEEVAATEE